MLDITRSGFDNLSLIAGYDWQAKMVGAGCEDWQASVAELTASFDKLNSADERAVVDWENAVRTVTGMPLLALPPEPVVAAPAVSEPVVEDPKVVPKTQAKSKSQK